MGIEATLLSIEKVISYWQKQNIKTAPKALAEIQRINEINALQLPADFLEFYCRANGMRELYPNDYDIEGFLFYPVEVIRSAHDEFGAVGLLAKRKIFIFSDYMLKCWYYGYEVADDGSYTVGTIGTRDDYKPITNSLAEFLELYMVDAPILYDE